MKKIAKIALIMLSVISFTSANAGALNVTGAAKATYAINSSASASGKSDAAKAFGVTNEFNLGAAGELDNGWTWAYNINIDDSTVQDDGGLSVGTPYGTVAINISQGGLELSKAAAVTANGYRSSDTGYSEGMVEEHTIGDMNNIAYATPAGLLPFGVVIKAAYAPDTTANKNASDLAQGSNNSGGFTATSGTVTADGQGSNMGRTMSAYQVTAAPIEGLSIGASYQEYSGVVGATAQGPESGSWYAKYAYGPATIAYGKAYIAHALARSNDDLIEYTENTKYSLAFNVNDNLSVSYSVDNSTANHKTRATKDIELSSTGIAAAYTMGGMTMSVAKVQHENVGYAENKDVDTTLFVVSMAF
jgi:hypothetical protein